MNAKDIEDVRNGLRPFMDIEWYAQDLDGNIASLVTAGFAAVPLCVFKSLYSYEQIDSVIESLDADQQTIEIAQGAHKVPTFVEVASKGLYVYDWDHNVSGYERMLPYRMQLKPEAPIHVSLNPILEAIPKLNLRFSETNEIVIEEFFAELNL